MDDGVPQFFFLARLDPNAGGTFMLFAAKGQTVRFKKTLQRSQPLQVVTPTASGGSLERRCDNPLLLHQARDK